MSCSRIRCLFVLLLALLTLAAGGGSWARATATTNPLDVITTVAARPVLTGVACTGGTPGILMVTGEGFTPGGNVEVLLFEPGSARPVLIRSVRASQSILGPNGTTDPALGFQRGGFVGRTVAYTCEETALVRAVDRQTGTWTNELNVDLGCGSVS
jgi:hypothetical protein